MKCVGMQMIDGNISSDWWKELVKHFVKENAKLQIRCWNEELDEIKQALRYGVSHVEGYETCIDGAVSAEFINELLSSDEPEDKDIYNKMTQYFTIHVSDGKNEFESSHYGTELYFVMAAEDIVLFDQIMESYRDRFSILITEM